MLRGSRPRLGVSCPNAGLRRQTASWCWGCYENYKGKANHVGHLGHRAVAPAAKTWRIEHVKKPEVGAAAATGSQGCSDERLKKKYPTLVEWMSETKWEDGSVRETSSISFTLEGGIPKLALNDRALKRTLYLTADTLEVGLEALERHLRAGTGDWRAWSAKTKTR
jgi:hypothetical protein